MFGRDNLWGTSVLVTITLAESLIAAIEAVLPPGVLVTVSRNPGDDHALVVVIDGRVRMLAIDDHVPVARRWLPD